MTDLGAALAGGPQRVLLVGMGVTNRAVATALLRRKHIVVTVDDRADDDLVRRVRELDVELVASPDEATLRALVRDVDLVCPAPGLPDSHPVFRLAAEAGCPLVSELDLAAVWDDRPIVAITGTNGKTTVVELAVDALKRSGIEAVAAGNTDVPLVEAIHRGATEIFVVEASSFRLARATEFAPLVGTWLNFAPNHLDVHADLRSYEDAKARLFSLVRPDGFVVANAADPVVMRRVPAEAKLITFGTPASDWRIDGSDLLGPAGRFTTVDRLWRSLPHDVEDTLAVAATVTQIGASLDAVAAACEHFRGLAHRVTPAGEVAGSVYYDDSKATTPHATLAALNGFSSVVLIAGGRNKGIDLTPLLDGADRIAGVVTIGEAAAEIGALFGPTHTVAKARNMDHAVRLALDLAADETPVLLSPGCASFDAYTDYAARGDDFVRAVAELSEERR